MQMKKGARYRCDKGFPKNFSEETDVIDDGYVLPKKPNDGTTCMKMITGKVSFVSYCTN